MVDGVTSTGIARPTPAAPVTAAKAPVADGPRAEAKAPAPAAAPSIGNLAKTLAAAPPVDKDRVAQIKRAIQTGTFPILPATIADRLLALKLEWSGRDEA
jgi:negative regulator of flagellin synthesis FlgM